VFHLSRLWQVPRSERASYLRTRLEWLKVLLRNRRLKSAYAGNREHAPRDRLFEEILFLSALNYAPQPYGGRMLFLRPQQRPKDPYADLTFDWKNLVRTLECVEVPGDHTTMFHEPNAQVLAERIRLAIDACRSSRQGATPAEAQSAEDRAQAA
jgi:thioesterase domain-containing protein